MHIILATEEKQIALFIIKSKLSVPYLMMFQFIAKEEMEKNERTQMKQLTLEINERQEEEELQVKRSTASLFMMWLKWQESFFTNLNCNVLLSTLFFVF